MELADTPDLGSGAERRGGSSPPSGTMLNIAYTKPQLWVGEETCIMQNRKPFRTYSGIRLPGCDRSLIKKLLLFGFVIFLSLFASGFRISNSNPEEVVDNYEENFQVGSQVELYKAVTVDRDGVM